MSTVGETHRLLQPPAAEAHQPSGHEVVAHPPLQLGYWPAVRPLPTLLTPGDLMLVFQVKRSMFYKLQKLGRFRRFEAEDTGPHVTLAIYSGAKVAAYCEGRSEFAFGRKRAR